MKRLGRIIFIGLATMSALLLAAAVILRVRTTAKTDAFMIPTGDQSAILFISQCGQGPNEVGWGELTFLGRWPGARLGWWSGSGQDVGPLVIPAHRPAMFPGDYSFWERVGMHIAWTRSGTFLVLKDSPSGPISYENSHLRAQALGYPHTIPQPPDTVYVTGRQLLFPLGPIIPVAAILPAILIVRMGRNWLRRQSGVHRLQCANCGYDLRATRDRCPECGTVPAKLQTIPLHNEPSRTSLRKVKSSVFHDERGNKTLRRKQVGRITYYGMAAVSWLLCLAAACLWVRSSTAGDRYSRHTRSESADGPILVWNNISWWNGQVCLGRAKMQYGRGPWSTEWGTPQELDALWPKNGWHIGDPTLPGFLQDLGLNDPFGLWLHYRHLTKPYPGTSSVYSARVLVIPLWLLFAVTAALPAWQLRATLRKRGRRRLQRLRQRRGLCPSCGYGPLATFEECPECGRPAAANAV